MANEQNSWEQQVKARGELTPGSKLLLPMHMDALVTGAKIKDAKWKNTALKLLSLKNSLSSYGLGKYLDRPSDSKPEDELIHDPGIHLHWVLPKVFRHGIQKESDGAPIFPLAPNRWLVVRTSVKGDKTITKSWIVESDFITKGDAADPNWLLLNNAGTEKKLTAATSSYEAVQTGRKKLFTENWQEGPANPMFLTIMAPGDPAFAASYASCKGVFGFHDDMMENEGNKDVPSPNGMYAYMVTGWYSDPSKDILQEVKDIDSWIERMKELSFDMGLPQDSKDKILLPDAILCHSMVFDVEWKGATVQYNNTQLPDTEFVEACVGYSAMDALAPLVLKNIPVAKNSALESFFAAFQYKMVADFDSDSGKEVLKKQVHAKTFNALHGGNIWVIERKETKNAGNQKIGLFPPLPSDISQKLKDLNALQWEHDEKINELHSLQSQLYAFWFKRTWTYTEDCQLPIATPADQRRISELRTRLKNLYARDVPVKSAILLRTDELKARLIVLKDALKTSETVLQNALNAITIPPHADLALKETKMPPYYLAKDPSVVISGVQPSDKYRNNIALSVRFANQLINKITYVQDSEPKTVNIPAAQLNEVTAAAFPANKNIPAEIKLLFNELQLLNPSLSFEAAKLAYQLYGGAAPPPERVKILADQISDLVKKPAPEKFKNEKNLAVVLPAMFSFYTWAQPWTPLFMEWAVEWFPSYTTLSQQDVMSKWNFGNKEGGIYNNVDFVFKEIKPGGQSKKYSGRIPLTADLDKKIRSVFAKDLSFLSSSELESMQPLSQELSGLNNNLIMRENSTQLPPLSFSTAENKFITNPLVLDIDDQYTWNPMSEETGFFPFRGGHFKLTSLRIIDSFGQVVDILRGKINVSQSLPVIADSAITYMQMPLRIAQPARLRFKWMSASEVARETDSDPGTSPVCGWLLCNKLDKSLMVFDAAGNAIGALRAIDEPGEAGASVTWANAPGVEGDESIDQANLNEHSKGVVKSLLNAGTAVLNALIDHISELQKRAHAKTSRQHITMALPVGYPVAIVKASCKLELKDLPAQYQGWDWETYDASFSNVKFPVYLGDVRSKTNGLAGYFLQGDYTRFNMPYAYDKPQAHAYFVNNASLPVAAAQDGIDMIVLMDPRMSLPVNCGILPSASYELPGHLIDQAIESIQLSFLVNPLITPVKDVQLPLAALAEKEWRWVTVSKERTASWKEQVLDKAMKGVLTFEPLRITEGWLKLVNKPKDDQST